MGAFLSREDEEEDEVKLGLNKDLIEDKDKGLDEEPVVKSSKRSKTRSKRKSAGKTKRYKYY
jgi:hypothetical protein